MSEHDPFNLSDEDLLRIKDVYRTCVDLVENQLELHDHASEFEELGCIKVHAVRYQIITPPTPNTCPPPYSNILEKSSIVAFQRMEFEESPESSGQIFKIGLFDPFRQSGDFRLLMLTVQPESELIPRRPDATINIPDIPENPEAYTDPFASPELTNNLSHLLTSIRKLSETGQLRVVTQEDMQGMYKLHDELAKL
jgi:hypothetical protein